MSQQSQAFSGVGTLFRYWSGSAWVSLGEVNNISGPGFSRETIDTTSLATTGGYRTFITGFRNPGTISFDLNFLRDDFDLLKTHFDSDDLQDYEIVLPDADQTSLEFQGLLTEMPLTIPPGDKVTISVTIQISGEVTIESGSGS